MEVVATCVPRECSPIPTRSLGETLYLVKSFGSRCEILMAILGDMDVVFNAYTSHAPVPLQDLSINVLAQLGGLEDGFNNEAAEIDLTEISYVGTVRPRRFSLPQVRR